MNLQWLYNVGLATKLTTAFLVVMSFTVFLGVFSICRLAAVDDSLAELSHKWVLTSNIVGRIAADAATFRGYETDYILSGANVEKAGYERSMKVLLDAVEKNLAAYEKLASLPEEKEICQGFRKAWEGYLAKHNEIMELSRQGKNADAIALCRGSSKIQFDKAGEFINEEIRYISDQAGKTGTRGDNLYSSSRNLIILLIIASFVLGLWLTHFIVRRVTCRSLWWALKSLDLLADGDLTQNIKVKSNEEIGKLFGAIKKIIDKLREFSSHVNELTHTLATSSGKLLTTTEEMNKSARE